MAVPKKSHPKRLKVPLTLKKTSGSPGSSSRATTSSRASVSHSLSREETAELQQLAQLLPVADSRTSGDPCAVLRAAALYIDQLRATVAARVRNGTLPRDAISKIFQMEQPVARRPPTSGAKRR